MTPERHTAEPAQPVEGCAGSDTQGAPVGGRPEGDSPRGVFVTFEGGDGVGKSTHIRYVANELRRAGARVVGTGRSDFPNQINNVVAFPGIFKGALEARATRITNDMKLAAASALAALVSDEELCEDFIMPEPFDPRAVEAVAAAVRNCVAD